MELVSTKTLTCLRSRGTASSTRRSRRASVCRRTRGAQARSPTARSTAGSAGESGGSAVFVSRVTDEPINDHVWSSDLIDAMKRVVGSPQTSPRMCPFYRLSRQDRKAAGGSRSQRGSSPNPPHSPGGRPASWWSTCTTGQIKGFFAFTVDPLTAVGCHLPRRPPGTTLDRDRAAPVVFAPNAGCRKIAPGSRTA